MVNLYTVFSNLGSNFKILSPRPKRKDLKLYHTINRLAALQRENILTYKLLS